MTLKRRQFLFLSSLSGLGLGFLAKMLQNQNTENADVNSAIAFNLVLEPTIAKSSPIAPILRFVSVADTGTGAQGQYAVEGKRLQDIKINTNELK